MRSLTLLAVLAALPAAAHAQQDDTTTPEEEAENQARDDELLELRKDKKAAEQDEFFSSSFCSMEKMPFTKRSSIRFAPANKVELRGQEETILFEVALAVPIPLVYWCPNFAKTEKAEHRLQTVFELDSYIRMTNHESSPVATPSYNPYLYVAYELWAPFDKKYKTWVDYDLNVRFTPLAHHSNGQDGLEFYDAAGDPTRNPTEAVALNVENGSFSTNYLEWSLHNRFRGWLSKRWHWMIDVQAGYQRHHETGPGALDMKTIGPLWGKNQIWWSLEIHTGYTRFFEVAPRKYIQKRSGILNFYAAYEGHHAFLDESENVTAITGIPTTRNALEAGWLWYRNRQFGLFVRASWGRDYYNIRFAEEPLFLQFGFTATIMETPGLPENRRTMKSDVYLNPKTNPYQSDDVILLPEGDSSESDEQD